MPRSGSSPLHALRVVHQAISSESLIPPDFEALDTDVWAIETCQRRLWIVWPAESEPLALPEEPFGKLEVYAAEDAYRFLLEVTTGLASKLQGEADVFGQIKAAWSAWQPQHSELRARLSPWMQNLFEDAKEIRSRHLQQVGTGSYASLVRRVLREQGVRGDLLLAGAGHLGRAIAPYLLEFVEANPTARLWIQNRTPYAAHELVEELRAKTLAPTQARIRMANENPEVALGSPTLILSLPAETESDRDLALHAKAHHVIHLGGNRAELTRWSNRRLWALDDLLALQRESNLRAQAQIAAAQRACSERARLRALPGSASGSLSVAHGWEDLAAF